jgi:phosphoribosyl-ATP pyrophosphohydrolase/phosphoribosyl-AMP cyclohydrolase
VIETDIDTLDWAKGQGLLPAVIQHVDSGVVLMLGFMSPEALLKTLCDKRVTLYSRTRKRLWTKGEISGNYIAVEGVTSDCDRDSLLVMGRPHGPVCHTGAAACFVGEQTMPVGELSFLSNLENIIAACIGRKPESGYTAQLYAKGRRRIAQKVGEEGIEVALAAVGADDAEVISESADLLFHLLLLLKSRGQSLITVVRELESRHAARAARA